MKTAEAYHHREDLHHLYLCLPTSFCAYAQFWRLLQPKSYTFKKKAYNIPLQQLYEDASFLEVPACKYHINQVSSGILHPSIPWHSSANIFNISTSKVNLGRFFVKESNHLDRNISRKAIDGGLLAPFRISSQFQ